jgi:hypothetical protein
MSLVHKHWYRPIGARGGPLIEGRSFVAVMLLALSRLARARQPQSVRTKRPAVYGARADHMTRPDSKLVYYCQNQLPATCLPLAAAPRLALPPQAVMPRFNQHDAHSPASFTMIKINLGISKAPSIR